MGIQTPQSCGAISSAYLGDPTDFLAAAQLRWFLLSGVQGSQNLKYDSVVVLSQISRPEYLLAGILRENCSMCIAKAAIASGSKR